MKGSVKASEARSIVEEGASDMMKGVGGAVQKGIYYYYTTLKYIKCDGFEALQY